ncbi:DUF4235 domain-containing protein [Luteolibacter sp. GHJ8]|uniref:DUF4235 domain-containing protein n=2 Tax=Luteolibacter rhizosphaerae TaxID=2989719 RepID=A0ABT3FX04_9BACT|nr:DUF4235 domain-containing protein [Luteolibacter rhizosphaerae]
MMIRRQNSKFLVAAALGLALPALADRVVRMAAGKGFAAFTGEPPPRNPATIGVSWGQAFVWTAVAGALGGVARMAARKALSRKLPTEH